MKKYSTKLGHLYGSSYKSKICIGSRFWYCFEEARDGVFWQKIEITYLRSGVAFYVLVAHPELGEFHFDMESFMAEWLEPEYLDPEKDLGLTTESNYVFDDSRTILVNWENKAVED